MFSNTQPEIDAPFSGSAMLYKAGDLVVVYDESGVTKTPNANARILLDRTYAPAPTSSGTVVARMQTRQYLSQTVTSATSTPTSVAIIVRTLHSWEDRVAIRIAVQVKDQYGSPETSGSYALELTISDAGHSLSQTYTNACVERSGTSGNRYSTYCSITSSPGDEWFDNAASATVSVALKVSSVLIDTATSTDTISFVSAPTWYSPNYRSTSEANSRVSPPGYSPTNDKLFATLPISPVYAQENFDVFIYASSLSFAINAWRVQLYYDTTKFDYVNYVSSGKFQSPAITQDANGITLAVAGLLCGTGCTSGQLAEVTGDVIYLARIRLRSKSGQSAGDIETGIYPYAYEILNDGNGVIQDRTTGIVFDKRGSKRPTGQIEVQDITPRGIFAYPPPSNKPIDELLNSAHLDGNDATYTMVVNEYNSIDTANEGGDVVSTGDSPTCSFPQGVDANVIDSVTNCVVRMTTSETASQSGVVLGVQVISESVTMNRNIIFDVYAPQSISILSSDANNNLERITVGSTSLVDTGCTGDETVYQTSRLRAIVDGVDMTTEVSFFIDNTNVVRLASAGSRTDIVRGVSVGSTTVRLYSGAPNTLSLSVSDTQVTATVTARLVTGLTWVDAPPSSYSYPGAVNTSVKFETEMNSEGDNGLIYTSLGWSDGSRSDVGYDSSLGSLAFTRQTTSIDVDAPGVNGNNEDFTRVTVAQGASPLCTEQGIEARVSLCGTEIVTPDYVPIFLDLPLAIAVELSISQNKLTSTINDARLSPIGVATTSTMTLTVTFQDTTTGELTYRDLTSDSRVTYTAVTGCASVDNGADTVTIDDDTCVASTATVSVELNLDGRILADSTTVPVVGVDNAQTIVQFRQYPSGNAASSTIGLIECTSDYHSVNAQMRVFLTDGTGYTLNNQAAYTSGTPAVATVSSQRVLGVSAGNSLISGTFGSSTSGSETLTVSNTVVNQVNTLVWTIPTTGTTLLGVLNDIFSTSVRITFVDGLVFDLDTSESNGVPAVSSMVDFSSDTEYAVAVTDTEGTLQILTNSIDNVVLSADLTCRPAVSDDNTIQSNLEAAELDVDLGSATGLQFTQIINGEFIDIEVRANPGTGKWLRSLSLVLETDGIGVIDPANAVWTDPGTPVFPVTVATQIPGEPQRLMVLSGASAPSGSTPSGEVFLGTLRVTAVGAGHAVVYGDIQSIETISSRTCDITADPKPPCYSSATAQPVVAGNGVVSVDTSTVFTVAEYQELFDDIVYPSDTRRLSECDPCGNPDDRVPGDVNGDCKLLSSDASALQAFIGTRQNFENTGSGTDPLDLYTANGQSCAWLREQLNPDRNKFTAEDGYVNNAIGKAKIDTSDVVALIRTEVGFYRFLTGITTACTSSSGIDVTIDLSQSDGTGGAIDADGQYVDVKFEMRIDPTRTGITSTVGTIITSDPSFPSSFPDYPGGGTGTQTPLVMQAEAIGGGQFRAAISMDYQAEATDYYVAFLIETKNAQFIKTIPTSYQSLLGSDLQPYSDSGITFNPSIGSYQSLVLDSAFVCNAINPPPSPPPPSPPPPAPPPPSPPPPSPPPLPPPPLPPPPSPPPPSPPPPTPPPPVPPLCFDQELVFATDDAREDIAFSENLGGGTGITIAGWVEVESLTSDNGFMFQTSQSGADLIAVQISGGTGSTRSIRYRSEPTNGAIVDVQTSNVITTGTFTHVAVVVQNVARPTNDITIYINGQSVLEASSPAVRVFPLGISRNIRDIGGNYRGRMRDVVGLNRALTASEIALLMRRELDIL